MPCRCHPKRIAFVVLWHSVIQIQDNQHLCFYASFAIICSINTSPIGPESYKALPKAQRTQGIEYFDSFNTFSSMQKLQQALQYWSNFSSVSFDRGREKNKTTLTNPWNNFDKSMHIRQSQYDQKSEFWSLILITIMLDDPREQFSALKTYKRHSNAHFSFIL